MTYKLFVDYPYQNIFIKTFESELIMKRLESRYNLLIDGCNVIILSEKRNAISIRGEGEEIKQ